MKFFTDSSEKRRNSEMMAPSVTAPRKSVVQVRFPTRGLTLAYYNDRFDLKPGDLVFVDGKLEALRGRVVDVNYNFRIRIADYKRVIAVADTEVHGKFFKAGSHVLTCDPSVLPKEKAASWFLPPADEADFVSGTDDALGKLVDPDALPISPEVFHRGVEYYRENRVRYLSVDHGHGYAIVEGTHPYEVTFNTQDGKVGGLLCTCYCMQNCKHIAAVTLQLKELLEHIQTQISENGKMPEYFAAIHAATLFSLSIEGQEHGYFTL